MFAKQRRYRVGIDVGLNSVGLAAVEIDDSSDDPRDAMPVGFLSIQSVMHDGGVDPSAEKSADSRKAVSGVERRVRKMHKRKRVRLRELDELLQEYGYPVDLAKSRMQGSEHESSYLPWYARIAAASGYIADDDERLLAVTLSLLHIARHRGWRNPYSSVRSLEELSTIPSEFYKAFVARIEGWRHEQGLPFLYEETRIDDEGKIQLPDWEHPKEAAKRLTPAQVLEDCLDPNCRIRKEAEEDEDFSTQMGKLHQSDNYFEIDRIFEKQKIPADQRASIFDCVFQQVNPRDVGAAAKLVGKDDLQPGKPRASKASIAFQKYRILATITNLRINEDGENRELTPAEIKDVYDYLTSEQAVKASEISWHDVAEVLHIDRTKLKGTGGQTEDGDPISAKVPPIVTSEQAILNACKKKELKLLREWWDDASDSDKEALIEFLGNAGGAEEISILDILNEDALQELEKIKLASGRAAYSIDTLQRLNERMLAEGIGVHEARKLEFKVDDDWRPAPEPLGTPTGNPAVDRTIKIVSRWLKACERAWGKPETINIEHVRDGFSSPKKARKDQQDMDKRYRANLKIREEIVAALEEEPGADSRGVEAISHADVRREQAITRQNNQCTYCGDPITFSTSQMDHIVPRKGAGSSNDLPNLVATCESCNKSKNNTLFYNWASKERMQETLDRVDTWIQDSYFTSKKQFETFKKDVKARLKQREEDEPLDNRSIESVAWMARVLREQIEGYFSYTGAVAGGTESNDEFTLQRVSVFRGTLTSEARKASGLENSLPWIGDKSKKTRLDRRHHAVDAAVIALLRPSVGKVLTERELLRREQLETNKPREELKKDLGARYWKKYTGAHEDSQIYVHWKDEQMQQLRKVLSQAMEDDEVVVTNYKRLRLGVGKAHKDTVTPLIYRKVGDALTPACIDKASTPALWLALTRHPDFDKDEGLPQDWNRRIRIHDRWLEAYDDIGFMAASEDDLDKVKNAVYTQVRGGCAELGDTIHHVRFYRIPNLNKAGKQIGWAYAYIRVFQEDLVKHRSEDLFAVDIPPQSVSRRYAVKSLRDALDEGTAEFLGWAVTGDEILINPDDPYFDPGKSQKINLFMRAFPGTDRFRISGFMTNDKITLIPMQLSSEGLPDLDDDYDQRNLEKTYGKHNWTIDELKNVNKVIDQGCPLAINAVLSTLPTIIRRNTLGEVRDASKNHMPTSWTVAAHPSV